MKPKGDEPSASFAAVARTLWEKGWSVIPLKGKRPYGRLARGWPRWNSDHQTEEEVSRLVSSHRNCNVGIPIPLGVVALDVDVVKERNSAEIARIADDILGPTPLVRVGSWPKFMRFYRASDSIVSEKSHPIEVFAGSGQVVAFGIHPDTQQPYRWEDKSPLELRPDDGEIPFVEGQQLDEFFAAVAVVLGPEFNRSKRPSSREIEVAEWSWSDGLLGRAFEYAGLVRDPSEGLKAGVICPWTDEHSGDDEDARRGAETSSVVFGPSKRWGPGVFHCSHAHCAGQRTRRDVMRWLSDNHGAELERARDAFARESGGARGGRPVEIDLAQDFHIVVETAVEALEAAEELYEYDGRLVAVVEGESSQPAIRELSKETLAVRLSPKATFTRYDERGSLKTRRPDDRLLNAILHHGSWPVPHLEGVRSAVAFRPDRTLCTEAGFDLRTRLYFGRDCPLPGLKEQPLLSDAHGALRELKEIVADFPFSSSEDVSAWLAALLTPLTREMYSGPAPLFVFDGNQPGVGKTLLAEIISLILTGRRAAVMAYVDEAEMRKRITSMLGASEPVGVIDNVTAEVFNAPLTALLSSGRWSDRILGGNRMCSRSASSVTWYMTGNNLRLSPEMVRRTVYVGLDCCELDPAVRTNFRHANLLSHVSAESERLRVALCTVLRAYFQSGDTVSLSETKGTYEDWSDCVRKPLVWAGEPDPIASLKAYKERVGDPKRDAFGELLRELSEAEVLAGGDSRGMSAGEILEVASQQNERGRGLGLALSRICSVRPPRHLPSAKQLGHALAKLDGTSVDGRRLRKFSLGTRKHVWGVEAVDR